MSDLKEILQENSYMRQHQLIFADCDRYQRARVSTLLSMAAAVAGASGGAPIVIDGAEDAAKSYPHFFEDLERLKGSAAPADLKTRN